VPHQEIEWSAADKTRLFAQAWEPAGGQSGVIAIVHGLGEHSGRYAEVAGQLVDAGYAVLTFDQRGHGRSEGPRGHAPSYDVLLDDLEILVAQARRRSGTRPVFLYGHSMGGNLVLNYALRRQPPLAGLVVTSPVLRPTLPPPAWKLAAAKMMNRVWPTFSLDNGVDPSDLSHDEAAVQAYREDPLVHGRVSARLGTALISTGVWALEHAGQLSLPLLLMHGSADALTSPAATAEFAGRLEGRCELKIWEGLFHELQWERERETVVRFVVDWLRQIAGGRG
jgi:alpha-beta hydrolase superfamily lysophospholipase